MRILGDIPTHLFSYLLWQYPYDISVFQHNLGDHDTLQRLEVLVNVPSESSAVRTGVTRNLVPNLLDSFVLRRFPEKFEDCF